jgi:hypothetical protein
MLAFATGDPDARTSAHIAACAACAARAATYATIDQTLHARLFRADCPATQTLGELSLGLLDPEQTTTLRGHLALCPHCAGELATLDATLRGDPMEDLLPQPGLLARIAARLLPAAGMGAAYAGVRGTAHDVSVSYGAAGLTLSLSVEAAGSGVARRWTLLLLVVDDDGGAPPAGASVTLLRDQQTIAEEMLDEWGNLIFPGLESGTYTLELALSARVIVVEGIEVGAGE